MAVGVFVGVDVAVRVAVAVWVAVVVAVAVGVGVAVSVCVAVAVEVCVAVVVGVSVAVAVGVAVRVAVAVAVGVVVAVGVAVAVAAIDPIAEPLSLTLAERSPLVASLVTVIEASNFFPACVGANSTVIVATACGRMPRCKTCPEKNWLAPPVGASTATERATEPVSVIVNVLVAVAGPVERSICPNCSLVGETLSSLPGCAAAAGASAAITINSSRIPA